MSVSEARESLNAAKLAVEKTRKGPKETLFQYAYIGYLLVTGGSAFARFFLSFIGLSLDPMSWSSVALSTMIIIGGGSFLILRHMARRRAEMDFMQAQKIWERKKYSRAATNKGVTDDGYGGIGMLKPINVLTSTDAEGKPASEEQAKYTNDHAAASKASKEATNPLKTSARRR